MEEALYTQLKTDATLATMLETAPASGKFHIYPLRLPDAFPATAEKAISYTQVSEERVYPNLKVSRMQISCFGRSFSDARDLSDAVDNCLNYLSAHKMGSLLNTTFVWTVGKQSLYDSVSKLWYYTVDINIKY